jgi:predicted MFS family arabinose efflux permease
MGIISLSSVFIYCIAVSFVEKFPKEEEVHHAVLSLGTEADVDGEEDNDFIGLNSKKRVAIFFAASMVMGFLFTSLYFMVNNNLDMYLKEIGGFSNSIAKTLTIFAPVCAVVGPLMTVRSCERHKNFIAVAAFYFGVALLSVLVMLLVFDKSVSVSLALLVLFLVFVNGGRSVTLSIASLKMRKKIDTGVYSTAVNAVSSIASGISPKFIAMILDNESYSLTESWRISFLLIFAFIFASVALLGVFIFLIKRLNKKDKAALEKSNALSA